ncbi:MAG TPA: hypothetical protein VFP84_36100 [Kofleriaceae bacterium]|nr:hypothetical protein [Kofleriaceae bacterium]
MKLKLQIVAHELVRGWRLRDDEAYRWVLSAIGEPKVLDQIAFAHRAEAWPLIHVIVHRRALDLLKRYAWPARHCSIDDATATDGSDEPGDLIGHHDPHHQLATKRLIAGVHAALGCFGSQGKIRLRQSQLLRRHIIDQVSQAQLSVELACKQAALRVRLHKAKHAFKSHLVDCPHPAISEI